MGYEIVEQLGWRAPDVILYPTGGGVGIIAIHKALQEMRELGWLRGDLPRLVAVQATGCAPIVDGVRLRRRGVELAPADPRTVAFGITVPKALGDFLVLDAVRAHGGTAVAVTDAELLAAWPRRRGTKGRGSARRAPRVRRRRQLVDERVAAATTRSC